MPESYPVIPFDKTRDKIINIDLSESNQEITSDILLDTPKFTAYINNLLKSAGARYAIGGYGEKRAVYSRSALFGDDKAEPRRIHLGIDIWGKPYTNVRAPLEGIIHSFADNNNFGDYGATLILSHVQNDRTFYTLYGHLSLNSIKNLHEGESVSAGDVIGEFGIPSENGNWPPHLHLQVINDLQGWKGDYPGVCAESEKNFYLSNCPDPTSMISII